MMETGLALTAPRYDVKYSMANRQVNSMKLKFSLEILGAFWYKLSFNYES